MLWRRQARLDIFEIQIVTNIAIEVAITRVARISLLPAPNLARGLGVSAKCHQSGRSDDRRVSPLLRARIGQLQPVRFHDEPLNSCFAQHIFDDPCVRALRQPETGGTMAAKLTQTTP